MTYYCHRHGCHTVRLRHVLCDVWDQYKPYVKVVVGALVLAVVVIWAVVKVAL